MTRRCEDYLKLSIYRLRELHLLTRNMKTKIYWGESNVDITLLTEDESPSIILSYLLGKERIDTRNDIKLIKTSCKFGGFRWWLQCPKCPRKYAKLYLCGGVVACRKCLRLTYKSQHDTPRWRRQRRFFDYHLAEEPQVRTRFWKGFPTKRMMKYLNRGERILKYNNFETNF